MRPCVGEIADCALSGGRDKGEGGTARCRIGISYVSPQADYLWGQQWRGREGTIACSPVNRNSKAACLPHGGLNPRL